MGIVGLLTGVKAAGAWSWSLITMKCRNEVWLMLYLNFPLCLYVTHRDTGNVTCLWRSRCDNIAVLKFYSGQQVAAAYLGNLFGRFNKCSWWQREWVSGGGSLLFRGSGGSCNLVPEISFRI